ncbi:MAG: hypothetical protein FWF57_04315 [Defluviitaleaceae bacterium]|nr:hypothetical protein [Defluviitaleaceae bacterium]
MFFIISSKLAKLDTKAGELARFLLDENIVLKDKDVIEISKSFENTLNILKEDKEGKNKMNFVEYYVEQGKEQGKIEGKIEIIKQAIKSNYSLDMILSISNLAGINKEELKKIIKEMGANYLLPLR